MAVTLLACPFEAQDERGRRAEGYLREFTGVLAGLDHSDTINTLSAQSWVDIDRS